MTPGRVHDVGADPIRQRRRGRQQAPDLTHAVQAAKRGDETAFEELYTDLQPRLLRYLRTLVGDAAEDIAAETWMQVTGKLPSFDGDSAGFRAWTTTIARNRAIDHLRHQQRHATTHIHQLTDLADHENLEDQVLDRISTHQALSLITQLPRDQAEAIMLRVVIGLDAKQAGRVLGKQAGAVRTSAHRGLRTLAAKLRPQPARPHVPRPRPAPDTAP